MIFTTNAGEPLLRLAAFLCVFALMALWEMRAPRRAQAVPRGRRWPGNIGVVVISTVLLRALVPTTAMGMAMLAEQKQWGVLHLLVLPAWLAVPLCVVLLDLLIYTQHVLFHAIPPLWRLHRMHHADLELDVTSGLRFHPGEMLLSLAIKLAAVAGLGVPPIAVLLFEMLLNATAMFNHANIALPAGADRFLRWFVVTPDMHRVHHSTDKRETDSNFGFNAPWWDWLFGTYRAQPARGQLGMVIGLAAWRDPAELRLDRMLLQPLRPDKNGAG